MVLSSDSPAYREALAGFEETVGHSVPTFILSKMPVSLPENPKYIVTFGGKAAAYPYPSTSVLIYALAPAIWISPEQHAGPRIRVSVAARQDHLVSGLKKIQPTLKHLAAFWVTTAPETDHYFKELQRAAKKEGVEVSLQHLNRIEDLPDQLRSLSREVNALWMGPDALLITPGAFAIFREFSRSNRMPLYVPMDSLVDKGAVASIASSFREYGRTAARIVNSGQQETSVNVFSDHYETTLNLTAAQQAGLTIPPDVVESAQRVVR